MNFIRFLDIPNLSYGSGQFSKKTAREKLQDEHMCLKLITAQIDALSAGFETTIMGQHVTVKPWIHFIAGDTSGHNNIVGQYTVCVEPRQNLGLIPSTSTKCRNSSSFSQ